MISTNSVTRSSVTRNAAVEEEVLVWSPALIMEIVITLFERILYILLCGISLVPQCLFHMSGSTTTLSKKTELLIDFDQPKNFQASSTQVSDLQQASSAPVKVSQQSSSAPVRELLILEDLIDLSEHGLESESSEDVVDNAAKIDSMVEKCLAALSAPSSVREM